MLGLGSPKRPSVDYTQSGSGHGGAVGQRALVAMAEAARRAREASSPASGVESEERTVVVEHPEGPPAAPQHHRAVEPGGDERGRRRLKVTVLSLAVVVLLVATALAVTLATKEGPVSSPVRVGAASGGGLEPGRLEPAAPARLSRAKPEAGVPPRAAPAARHRRRPARPPPQPPSVPVTGGGGPPVLSALSPSTGAAGQSVIVSGTNFISADGVVQARFGGQLAPTACPVQTSCTVTVPTMTGSPTSVPVTVTTAGGTSNALTFTFG